MLQGVSVIWEVKIKIVGFKVITFMIGLACSEILAELKIVTAIAQNFCTQILAIAIRGTERSVLTKDEL